jgi:hypothetical protein
MSGMALVLLVLPALALARVARRRPLPLGRLLLVPAIVGVTLAIARTLNPEWPPLSVLTLAAAGLPIIVPLALSGLWLIRKRWWRLVLLAAACFVVAVALAAIQMRLDAPQMAPWQRYSWDHWYEILIPASYGAGLLLTLGLVLATLVRLVRRGWRRAFGRSRPA